MSKATKTAYNIDKLKLCYRTTTANTFEYLTTMYDLNSEDKTNINSTLDRGKYILHLIDHSSNDVEATAITVSICIKSNDNECHKLGVLDIKKGSRYCFFSAENKALYTSFSDNEKHNCIHFIPQIAYSMGLEFNNISSMEIAKDSTRNYISAIQKYVRNYNDYEMFINGHLIKDENRIIPNYKKMYSSSRRKMSRTPTLYFSQSDGLCLKIYDKRREMNESEPSKLKYIPQWGGFSDSDRIYRAETMIKKRDIRTFLTEIGANENDVLDIITSPEKLAQMWRYATDRLLYFRSRANKEVITMADL